MKNALSQINTRVTPQMERTPGRTDEVKNSAGGFVFEVNDKNRLERFLILGTDGGTYYIGERDLTKQNFDAVRKMVEKDAKFVVDTTVAVSDAGRAPRNSAALFVMAVALTFCKPEDKAYVRQNVSKVARTATHLFEFAQYLENLGGWGRAKRGAIADWYESKSADELAYQAVKYRQRNGWTHRDLLRLSHAKPDSNVAKFILNKVDSVAFDNVPEIVLAFQAMQNASTPEQVLSILSQNRNLPWETIPTQHLKDVRVWKQLFENGQLRGQALLRNVTRLARLGAFDDMVFARQYADRLTDVEQITKSRIHPINYLNASVVYADGQVNKSAGWYSYGRTKDWKSVGVITDALNDGFHLAFKAVEPANKRTLLGVDVSGSMGLNASGLDLSCAQVAAAVAMTVARTEPYHRAMGFASDFRDLGITPKDSLQTILRKTSDMNFGSTDCSLPMTWALQQKIEVDTFVVITDNETWAGRIKPSQALQQYRDQTGIPARLAVLGVAASSFTIADPTDAGMMDFVGFDSAAPKVLTDFSAGKF